jgi:hypothetical protein
VALHRFSPHATNHVRKIGRLAGHVVHPKTLAGEFTRQARTPIIGALNFREPLNGEFVILDFILKMTFGSVPGCILLALRNRGK